MYLFSKFIHPEDTTREITFSNCIQMQFSLKIYHFKLGFAKTLYHYNSTYNIHNHIFLLTRTFPIHISKIFTHISSIIIKYINAYFKVDFLTLL